MCVFVYLSKCVFRLYEHAEVAEAAAAPPAGLTQFPNQRKSPLPCLVGLNPPVKVKTRREHLKENVQSHPVFLLSFSEGA